MLAESRFPRFRPLRFLLAALVVAGFVPQEARAQAGPDPDVTLLPAEQPLTYDTNLGLVERATNEAVDEALAGIQLDPGSVIRLHSLTNHEAAWFVEDVIAHYLSERGYKVHLMEKKAPANAAAPAGTPAAAGGNGGNAGGAGNGGSLADALAATSGTQPGAADSADSAVADSAATGNSNTGPGNNGPRANANTPGPAGQRRTTQAQAASEDPDPSEIIPIPEGEGLVLTFRLMQFGVTYHDSWRRGFMGPRVVERLASVNLFTRLVSGSAENVLWTGQGASEKLDIVPQSKLDLLEGMSYPFKKPEVRQKPLSRFLEPVLVSSIIGGLVYLFYSNQD